MYVIEDKRGQFMTADGTWTRSLQKAFKFSTKELHLVEGDRVFEVHLVLGKQVK